MKEQLYGNDYAENEDPSLYVSTKTNRGPLTETWVEDYWNEVRFKFYRSQKSFLSPIFCCSFHRSKENHSQRIKIWH